jgi:hypothetical protein
VLATLLAIALAAPPPASPIVTATPPPARATGVARVVQVTGTRAYLDAGEEDGLAVGQVLALRRGDAEAGRCTVDAVAPAHATCTGGAPRPGDTFRLAPRPTPAVKVVQLPAVPSDEELSRRAASLSTAPVAQVVDKASAPTATLAAPRNVLGEVALVGAYWDTSPGGTFEVARLDAAFHGAPLGPLLFDVDLRAERWLKQYKPTFRPDTENRFYLWQAQAGWYPADRPVTVEAGRVLALSVPGATVMDGAMVGRRGDGSRVSLFGGLVPEPDTLAPTTTRATAGAAWDLERRSGSVVFRQEGRVAWVRSPELGDRGELEATGALHSGSALDLFADVRLGAGGTSHAPGYVDGARVEMGLRPVARLAISAGFDYGGLLTPQPVVTAFYPGRTRHADGSAFYDFGPLRLGVDAGHSVDVVSSLDRTWYGPEIQIPRFFTPRVALSAGYLAEQGWLHGQSAFLQAVARPWNRLRLIARASWSHDATTTVDHDEFGGSLSGVADLTDRVGIRFSALYRAVTDSAEAGTLPTGLNAYASLFAAF